MEKRSMESKSTGNGDAENKSKVNGSIENGSDKNRKKESGVLETRNEKTRTSGTVTIERLRADFAEEAVELAVAEYQMECQRTKELPKSDFRQELVSNATHLFGKGFGVAAFEAGRLIGYMAFYDPMDGFFGTCRGAFSPLGGNAFAGSDRGKLSSVITAAAMQQLLKEEGMTSFAIGQYANDQELSHSFAMNGFGIRCSDAVMRLNEESTVLARKIVNKDLVFKEIPSSQKTAIMDLRYGLTKHLLAAPVFYPTHMGNYMQWFANDEIRVFTASRNDEILGYMSITAGGENFISNQDCMINICGAFVREDERGKQIADDLLTVISQTSKSEGAAYLGVDCETLNPTALRFWGKYFQNYTYSYHRRIDERILGYEEYLEREWKQLMAK